MQRRVYVYVAVLGSVVAVLVFGVDSAVGAAALAWHVGLLRKDRATLAAGARLVTALEGRSDITVRS